MHPSRFGSGVVLLPALDVRFEELPGPELAPDLLAAVDRAWEGMARTNPAVFDGPVVLCTDLRAAPCGLQVGWSRGTYRLRATRHIRGAPVLSSVFVAVVQPSADGRLVVGRMSESTSSPGLLQFPGGNLEPPPSGQELTAASLQRHAAAELAEETGLVVAPSELTLWAAARTSNSNLGFFFLAPRASAEAIREGHASLVRAERAVGREPEFSDVALVADADELAVLGERPADYLGPLVERFRATR